MPSHACRTSPPRLGARPCGPRPTAPVRFTRKTQLEIGLSAPYSHGEDRSPIAVSDRPPPLCIGEGCVRSPPAVSLRSAPHLDGIRWYVHRRACEDELHLPELASVALPEAGWQLLSIEQYLSFACGEQAGHHPREGGLAGAGFADHPDREERGIAGPIRAAVLHDERLQRVPDPALPVDQGAVAVERQDAVVGQSGYGLGFRCVLAPLRWRTSGDRLGTSRRNRSDPLAV